MQNKDIEFFKKKWFKSFSYVFSLLEIFAMHDMLSRNKTLLNIYCSKFMEFPVLNTIKKNLFLSAIITAFHS